MNKNPFYHIHITSRYISQFLPLGEGLALDELIEGKSTKKKRREEGQHWAVVSKTGGGKTFFTKRLIRLKMERNPLLNRYYLDTKKLGDFTKEDGPIIFSDKAPAPLTGEGQVQIWQPFSDSIDEYSKYFLGILAAGKPAIVDIDESANLKFGNSIPRGYEILCKQGRLPGIHVITCMQEIARSPRQGLSQATHVVSFTLLNLYDTNIMRTYLRMYNVKELPLNQKYQMLYINTDTMGQAKLYKNCQEFFKEQFSGNQLPLGRKNNG